MTLRKVPPKWDPGDLAHLTHFWSLYAMGIAIQSITGMDITLSISVIDCIAIAIPIAYGDQKWIRWSRLFGSHLECLAVLNSENSFKLNSSHCCSKPNLERESQGAELKLNNITEQSWLYRHKPKPLEIKGEAYMQCRYQCNIGTVMG